MKTQSLVARYLLKMDELNTAMEGFLSTQLTQSTPEAVIEKVYDFLLDAYLEGFAGVGFLLGDDTDTPDSRNLLLAVNQVIEGKTFRERVYGYANDRDAAGILLVANTDGHRVFNAGANDRAGMFQGRTGEFVSKTWITVLDDSVRDTHSYIHGETVELRERFFTFDGDSALYPGDFTRVENNANCRCILSYSTY